jgi:hypothetical protein
MAHTPGPWWWTSRGTELLGAGECVLAIDLPEFITEADKHMISAAPQLLAALKAVVDQFGPWHDEDCPADDTCDCSAKPIHEAVDAAIAKAEGR